MRNNSAFRTFILSLAVAMIPGSPAVAQQQPDAQEILRQIQQGQVPQGVQPLASLEGTWTYAVKPGLHTEMLKNQPSVEQIESQLPDGMSLDALPINMTGNAIGGSLNRWQSHEWTLAYVVQIGDEGEQVDDKWLYRGTGE